MDSLEGVWTHFRTEGPRWTSPVKTAGATALIKNLGVPLPEISLYAPLGHRTVPGIKRCRPLLQAFLPNRRFVALGYGGVSKVSRATGVSRRAITEGVKELQS